MTPRSTSSRMASGIFGSRIVRCQDHDVAVLHRRTSHLRALAPIAISTASKDSDNPPGLQRLGRSQQPQQGVFGVRIIHDDREILTGLDRSNRPGTVRDTRRRQSGLGRASAPSCSATPMAARRLETLCSPPDGSGWQAIRKGCAG